jgi:3-hydroxy-9,10-secoandrosta-1,3,5(10)-triene-9,17-dione monooxygenase reductase component
MEFHFLGDKEMNTKKLKKCLSLFATGITSIVTKKSKNYIGITVNSFSSVSLEPPLVMWCIDKKSSSIKSFLKVKNKYEIIFLSKSQRTISNKFASADNEVSSLSLNNIKKNSLGYMICTFYKKLSAGDHYIILHKVKTFKVLNDKKPLLFFKSKYC